MNIVVEGTRGKSGVVKTLVDAISLKGEPVIGKVTGLEAFVYHPGRKEHIKRKGKRFLIDKENRKILKQYKDVRFKVFENQALSPYTMKAFHLVFKPDIIAIPNIRYEHQDTLGETIEEQAKSFAINFKSAKTVITTEHKEPVLKIFRKYCEKYRVELIEVKEEETFPGSQTIHLVNEVIGRIFREKLSKEEFDFLHGNLNTNISINHNVESDISYFIGSKVNDIESTRIVYEYLKKMTLKKFCFVCYFRKDRPERTRAFIPFLKDAFDDEKIDRIFISGHHLGNLPKNPKIARIKEKNSGEMFDYCKENDCVMFTAVNGVNPFMQEVELNLKGGKT
jgi:gamma-polyglutamate synthase